MTRTRSRIPRPLRRRPARRAGGFTLVETLVGLFLVSVAMVGLVQLYTVSVLQNRRANELSNAAFLAQEEIDMLRGFTLGEMNARAGTTDENLDINADGTYDFRRITTLEYLNNRWQVMVLVFPPSQFGVDQSALLSDPVGHKVRGRISTLISR